MTCTQSSRGKSQLTSLGTHAEWETFEEGLRVFIFPKAVKLIKCGTLEYRRKRRGDPQSPDVYGDRWRNRQGALRGLDGSQMRKGEGHAIQDSWRGLGGLLATGKPHMAGQGSREGKGTERVRTQTEDAL